MRRLELGLRTDQFDYVKLIAVSVLVGVMAALGNLGFRVLIQFFSWLFRGFEWAALGISGTGAHAVLIPIVLMTGGIVILALDRIFPGDILGYGFPNFLAMVNLGTARVKRRWIFAKAAGAAVSLGAGAPVGREGPIAQVGGAIGSAIAQWLGMPADRARVLIAAGAGAGIATTFNAPMGGLMFAQEIVLLGHAELGNLTLLIIATTSAVVTSRAIMGDATVFVAPQFVLRSYFEMITYAVMGISLGVLAAAYTRFFHAVAAWFKRLDWPAWLKLEAGLAIAGIIAIFLPGNLSDGYPVINQVFDGKYEARTLAALMSAKFVTSSIALGAGTPGGLFGPTFFIGTMAGGTFQRVSAHFLPRLTGPRGSYALVGLGAFLAGTSHAPLTALFLLFEMTQNYSIALPAMIATISALVTARVLEPESIDEYALAREGKNLQIGHDRIALTLIPAGSVMSTNIAVVSEATALADVLRAAADTAHSTLPVVNSDGGLVGLIVTRDLLVLLGEGRETGPLVNAFDLCQRDCPVVSPEASLDEASQLMEYENIDEIPVVEHGSRRFIGLVTRQHIAQALNRVGISMSTIATRAPDIYWASGYRVTRIEVPARAAGRTLRELDPRARFNVSVLGAQPSGDSQAGFAPIAPDRPLREGDLLIAAGRSADVRAFVHDLEG
ncbi:MAG TPA: chloride channel protein [Candidatus Binataceae bacterium]|nr:chloride channel protein [Candidatus Binataceae bacterium]